MTDTLPVHLPREWVEHQAAFPFTADQFHERVVPPWAEAQNAISLACREALEAERGKPDEYCDCGNFKEHAEWCDGPAPRRGPFRPAPSGSAEPEPTTESGEPTERGEAGSREAPDTESEAGSSVAPSAFSPLRAERISVKRQQRIDEDFLLALDTSDPNMVRNAEIAALRADEARRVVGELLARLTFDSGVFGISGKRAIAIVREYGGQK